MKKIKLTVIVTLAALLIAALVQVAGAQRGGPWSDTDRDFDYGSGCCVDGGSSCVGGC